MDIPPIRTKRDYERALRRIETLMDAKSGTEEGDELEVLATLVDVYEEKYFPMGVADPRSTENSLCLTRCGWSSPMPVPRYTFGKLAFDVLVHGSLYRFVASRAATAAWSVAVR
jgi:hypothetical protein